MLCRDLDADVAVVNEVFTDFYILSAVYIDAVCAEIILPVFVIRRIAFRADVVHRIAEALAVSGHVDLE